MVPAKIRPPAVEGLRRRRLEEPLEAGLWERRLAVVVAPAGAGKTTLLAQFAASLTVPSAWYRAESSDGDAGTFLGYLETTLAKVLPRLAGDWASVDDAARALESCPDGKVLLVVDDLHMLQGTPAEAAFEQLLRYRPPCLAILAASRTLPNLSLLSRLRLAGELLELGAEDLRFRSWEVERLFSEHYHRPLPPEEAGELARRTEGWVAGLQMFHLGTTGKSQSQRRETLAALGVRTKLAREYLARNVLQDLPAHLRAFLLGTCVLGRLSGDLCDALLGCTGSEANLQELERRQVFTYAVEETGGYRYHEALRAHLEGVMLEELGPVEARRRYRQAAGLLERHGSPVDALRAYCRAEDWGSVARLLGRQGETLTVGSGDWLNLLPTSLRNHDPWVLLATARWHRACGRWKEAMRAYRAAEEGFGSQAGVDIAAGERLALASWLEPGPVAADWVGLIRAAAASNPLAVAAKAGSLPGARGLLAAGLSRLLGGEIGQARELLDAAARNDDASPEMATGALLASAVAGALAGDPSCKSDAESASRRADDLGLPWVGRMSQAVLALTDRPDGHSEAVAVRLSCLNQDDLWGTCLAALLEGLGAIGSAEARPGNIEQAAAGFAKLGAHTLEAWCLSVRALITAVAGDPQAHAAAQLAERSTRLAGLQAPRALAYLALARTDPERGSQFEPWAYALAQDCGLALPPGAAPETKPAASAPSGLAVRCFGGFSLQWEGTVVDLSGVKPRPRKLLHLLAMRMGRPVHREMLIEALWPGVEPEVGARNLHVALSTLRQFIQTSPCSEALRIVRDGEEYRLVAAPGSDVDVVEFMSQIELGGRCIGGDEPDAAIAALTRALALHSGDLLPEDGPDEWVVPDRESFRSAAVEVARTLAELLLQEGDPLAAARACELGLYVDRHRDTLWRYLQQAHETAGNHAAAAAARARYERILAELGIGPEQVSGGRRGT